MRTFLLCVTALLGGCAHGAHYQYTQASEAPPKPVTGDFFVLSAVPDKPFVELGTLDFEPGLGSYYPINASGFKQAVQSQVCSAGGDAVLTLVNANGWYVRGTVIRYR